MFKTLFIICFSFLIQRSFASKCNTLHCRGPILETIQLRNIFADSKMFVDMATKCSEEQILKSFNELPKNVTDKKLFDWVKLNFYEPGYELDSIVPDDWHTDVNVIKKQKNPQLQNLVQIVHNRWCHLIKVFNESKLPADSVSSLLHVKHPFVVPGGRFNEFYYWDSYWILEGLLASEMYETARHVILNFIDIINKYNFIPNGSRNYFLNRSQPPLLIKMLVTYFERTGDDKLIYESLRALDREYDFFSQQRVTIVENNDQKYFLNLYNVTTDEPRPESFKEDIKIAHFFPTKDLQTKFYSNVVSATESGWDFSIRWFDLNFVHKNCDVNWNLQDLTNVIPVDLNANLYYNERQLQRFYCKWASERAEFKCKCFWYGKASRTRFRAMKKILFNSQQMQWSDYNLTSRTSINSLLLRVNDKNQIDPHGKHLKRPLFLSDLSSLWYFNEDWRTEDVRKSETEKIAHEEKIIIENIQDINDNLINKLIENLDEILDVIENNYISNLKDIVKLNEWQEILFSKAGVPMSNIFSGQQWDFPNVWAPYQTFLIESLYNYDEKVCSTKCKHLALYLTKKWLHSNYCGFKKYNTFFEKYDAMRMGEPGGGGEYVVQEGFGWTNGAILLLADKFGPEIELSSFCENL